MSGQRLTSQGFWERLPHLLLLLALLAGIALSVAAQYKLCSACSETWNYRLFGLSFGWVGVGWFSLLAALHLAASRLPWCRRLIGPLLTASAGTEAHFMWLQKYEIGQWCPICLSIAGCVAVACGAEAWEGARREKGREVSMTIRLRALLTILVFFGLGLAGSLIATGREAQAGTEADLFLGKTASPTTLYLVSDWFCPVCRKMEPEFERLIPNLARSVRLGFVDYPVHKETLNFTPYHLQFLAREKEKYPALRRALAQLALKTRKPTEAEVRAAVAPLGVTLRETDYAETFAGMQANMALCRDYKIKATPSVVVANSRTKKSRVLVGENQISESAIKAAIAEVEK